MAPKKTSSDEYVYTKLKDITQPAACLNIYGVLLEVEKELQLRGHKYHGMIRLVDETCSTLLPSFRVHFFFNDTISGLEKGSILRIHRLKAEKLGDVMDGRIFRHTDIVIFPGKPNKDDKPKFITTAKSIQYTENDNRRLRELRKWIAQGYEPIKDVFDESQSGRISLFHNGSSKHVDNVTAKLLENKDEEMEVEMLHRSMVSESGTEKKKNCNETQNCKKEPEESSAQKSDAVKTNAPALEMSLKRAHNEEWISNKAKKTFFLNPASAERRFLNPFSRELIGNAEDSDNNLKDPLKLENVEDFIPAFCVKALEYAAPQASKIKKERISITAECCVEQSTEDFDVKLDGHLQQNELTTSHKEERNGLSRSPSSSVTTNRCGRSEELEVSDEEIIDPVLPQNTSSWLSTSSPLKVERSKRYKYSMKTSVVPLLSERKAFVSDIDKICDGIWKLRGTNEKAPHGAAETHFNTSLIKHKTNEKTPSKDVSQFSNKTPSPPGVNCQDNDSEDDIHSCSTLSASHSDQSDKCPGIACAETGCLSSVPVLLSEKDFRLANYDPIPFEELEIENVPPCTALSVTKSKYQMYLPFSENHQVFKVNLKDLKDFTWPVFQTKAQILKVIPSLKVLQTTGPKDLVAGRCRRCLLYCHYSSLCWEGVSSTHKRTCCPKCLKDGKHENAYLNFRMKLYLKDAWGTKLTVLATERNAESFLGISFRAYLEKSEYRQDIVKMLSRVINSSVFFKIQLSKVFTQVGVQYHIHNTSLQQIAQSLD